MPEFSKPGMPISVSRVPNSATPMDIHSTPASAGVYEFIGEEWFVDESTPSPVYVRQIRAEADPRYVPLRCRRIYRTPAGTTISRTYHVIGKYIPPENLTEYGEDKYVRLTHYPHNFPFPVDRIQPLRTLWAPWEKGTVEYQNCVPPEEVEFGPWVVEQMRAIRKAFDGLIKIDTDAVSGESHVHQASTTRDTLNEILHAESERDEALMTAAREEARYRIRHEWRHLKQAADEGRWTEPPSTAKPFVDLGDKKGT